jgi:hypothetical protein
MFLAIFAYIFFAISETLRQNNLENERKAAELAEAKRVADSITNEMRKADSIRFVEDSLKRLEPRSKQQAKGGSSERSGQKQGKSLHWGGPDDIVANAVFRKISGGGLVQKTRCAGNGMVVKVANISAACKSADAMGRISCSFSPKISVTNCNGQQIQSFEASEIFKVPATQKTPAKAREELAQELQRGSLNSIISSLKNLR